MKKVRKFDAGGMASSSPQPAFTQLGATTPAFGSGIAGGMGNTAPMVQANPGGTGVGGVLAAPAPAMAQAPAMTPTAPTQAMRRGGTVKKLAKGGTVKKLAPKREYDRYTGRGDFAPYVPGKPSTFPTDAESRAYTRNQRGLPPQAEYKNYEGQTDLTDPKDYAAVSKRSWINTDETNPNSGDKILAKIKAMSEGPQKKPKALIKKLVKKSGFSVPKFAKGGAVMGRGRGDGCVTKGGTKGTMR